MCSCSSPQALLADVKAHEEALGELESAVNDVITLVDEPDQADLNAHLQSVSLRYQSHCCDELLKEMMSWLEGVDLEGLRVRDPSSAVIENQQQKCQVLKLPTTTCLYMYVLYVCSYTGFTGGNGISSRKESQAATPCPAADL